jgi:uncharacterized membrane protein YkoI
MNTLRRLRLTSFAVALSALAPAIAAAPRVAHAEQQHQAKVPIDDARAKALELVPGKVVAEELEHEGGRWIYSFEIRPTGETRKIIKEVNIDADTGEIVGVDTENE